MLLAHLETRAGELCHHYFGPCTTRGLDDFRLLASGYILTLQSDARAILFTRVTPVVMMITRVDAALIALQLTKASTVASPNYKFFVRDSSHAVKPSFTNLYHRASYLLLSRISSGTSSDSDLWESNRKSTLSDTTSLPRRHLPSSSSNTPNPLPFRTNEPGVH